MWMRKIRLSETFESQSRRRRMHSPWFHGWTKMWVSHRRIPNCTSRYGERCRGSGKFCATSGVWWTYGGSAGGTSSTFEAVCRASKRSPTSTHKRCWIWKVLTYLPTGVTRELTCMCLGRILVFAPFTGVSLDGHIMLSSAEVRHNWLDVSINNPPPSSNPFWLCITFSSW